MFIFQSASDGIGGNGAKAYQCASCGGLITHSDRLLLIEGHDRHLFVNPAGVECDFHTFFSCPGALALDGPTDTHTWFPGYLWRLAFCRHCGQHIGWHYEAVSMFQRPSEFWGILVTHVQEESGSRLRH
jgi:hypothetical protein